MAAGSRSFGTLARISHRIKRIEAPNQRKLFCENDFLMIRGEPRCGQSVTRIFLDLKPSKAARWSRRLTVARSHRTPGTLLLGATNRAIGMGDRLASCFVDRL